MSENNDHPVDLFHRAMEFDREAFDRLRELQRSGRALRIYPNGRRGLTDPGCAVLLAEWMGNGTLQLRSSGGSEFGLMVQEFAFNAECLVAGACVEFMNNPDVLERQSSSEMIVRLEDAAHGQQIVVQLFPPDADHWVLTPFMVACLCQGVVQAITLFHVEMDEAYDCALEWLAVRELADWLENATGIGGDHDY